MSSTRDDPKPYQAIIIGSGQGGVPLAHALGSAGWKTAIIERDRVGGSCINYGCTPTKTMVASARVAYLARQGPDYGIQTGAVDVDFPRVMKRQRELVDGFRNGTQKGLEKNENIDLYFGEASFEDSATIKVAASDASEPTRLRGSHIFINTGTRAASPPVGGLSTVGALDNRTLMDLDVLPEHLLILGGGVIAVEFGQMFRRFGSRVSIVQNSDYLLGREDPEISTGVKDILSQDGIEIRLNSTATAVRRDARGTIHLELKQKNKRETLSGSHLLVAAGRAPNTDRLNLEAAGVETDGRGFISADEKLQTSADHVYAVGDVKGGPAFTHISYDDFRILRANLLEGGNTTTRDRLVPYTVFMDPQLGRVGMTEIEAKAEGREYRVARLPMTRVARALEMGETRGFMKVLVDANTDLILGAAILAVEGGEIMSAIQIAMMGHVPYPRIKDGVFAHPTLIESLNNLFMAMDRT